MTDDMLVGWDEIAGFLRVSVVTAWRYERDGGLPIIRLYNGKVRGSRAEISAWIILQGQKAPAVKEVERF
jgi:predicted site-specific integrase-resolvase